MRPSAPLEELQILLRGPLSLNILAEVDQFWKFSGVGPALRPRSPFGQAGFFDLWVNAFAGSLCGVSVGSLIHLASAIHFFFLNL